MRRASGALTPHWRGSAPHPPLGPQMVWESGCVVVVMLTPLAENGVRQCYRYWPDEGSSLYHIYEVLPGRPPGRGQGVWQLWAVPSWADTGRRPWKPQEVCPALRSADPADSRATGTLPEMVWFPFLNSMNPNSARKQPRKDLAGACFQEAALLTLVLRGPHAPRLPLLPGPCVRSAHSAF